MYYHDLYVHQSKSNLLREDELAWKFAEIASTRQDLDEDVIDMIINRIIDNVAVGIASINRKPIISARQQALCHAGQSTLLGFPSTKSVSPEWAAWANGVAVRELDYHDTFLAADYAHPADNIPPIIAVAQACKKNGMDILQGIATAYEMHVSLVKSICLHKHKIDHIAHLAPASAGGIGTLLSLPTEIIYQSIQQALHVSCTTRQSRKGLISTWKAYAPAHASKLAIEAVDRSMRGESSPTPIYEGEDSVIAWLLDGSGAHYKVPLIAPTESKRAILETYTKAYSAEYQSQALIDLAFNLRNKISDLGLIKKVTIHTSHHTHYVIGTGSGDPQKFDANASRETLDHSIMYIFAVALEDGRWHHVDSYTSERSNRPSTVDLWKKIETVEEEKWTKLYHHPTDKAFGGRVVVEMNNGSTLTEELAVANAHPKGKQPWKRKDYIQKFDVLTTPFLSKAEQQRFLELVTHLADLSSEDILQIFPIIKPNILEQDNQKGIFDYSS